MEIKRNVKFLSRSLPVSESMKMEGFDVDADSVSIRMCIEWSQHSSGPVGSKKKFPFFSFVPRFPPKIYYP